MIGPRKRKSRGIAYASCGSNHKYSMLWRVMADIVVAVHAAYVAIVVVGFAAILIGSAAEWRWVRNFYFRAAHLAMILLVCAEALVGTTCPLTRLENALPLRGGETGYTRDFIGYWLDRLIFYDAPSWVFTAAYLTFGMLVLSTLWLAPVRWPAFLIQMRDTDTDAKSSS
jgi:hypothetical protein